MNKALVVLLLLSTRAFADSPYVVAYQPPPEVDHTHHGLTLEFGLGGATTSLENGGVVTFAIGGWITEQLALTFRVTGTSTFDFTGGSAQYLVTRSLWFGAGIGGLSERGYDEYGANMRTGGFGGFARAGYQLAAGGSHALYVSGEVQVGDIADRARAVALFAFGYQYL